MRGPLIDLLTYELGDRFGIDRRTVSAILHRHSVANREKRTQSGAEGIRTPDPRTASAVRYQLRYSPEEIATGLPRRVGHRTRDR